MRCVADRDVLEDDITVAGRPPSRGVYRPGWLLLEMEELNDAFDGDEVHLKLTIALAELVSVTDDCSYIRTQLWNQGI